MLRPVRRVPRLMHTPSELLSASTMQAIPTHELLVKLGLVAHPKPGLVHWRPLGLNVLAKVEALAHKHMQAAGAEQVRMLALSPAALWQQTGRWAGTELFKLKDSAGADYCLAPTYEEEITALVRAHVASYKALPLIYYQITDKFRDEKRPRSGLLRGREFIMKDAYSFDVLEQEAMAAYETMTRAYESFFAALRVPFVRADADTGDIGGLMSHEWHYVHPLGEDTLFTCLACGASLNVEKTLSYPAEESEASGPVAVRYFTTADQSTLVCAYYPGTRELQPTFLKEEVPDLDLALPLSQDELLALFADEDTLISKRMVRVMDLRLTLRSNFPDFPVKFINRSLMTTLTDVPIVAAAEGEVCAKCEDGTLHLSRAIEVGHTFYLGDKYSRALGLQVEVPDLEGRLELRDVVMGCYGIGISRVIAAIAEITRDARGLRWPAAIAPWEATVVDASGRHGEEVGRVLDAAGVDCRLDDRGKIGLGRKVKEANAIGIPAVVLVGKKYPMVEIETRAEKRTVHIDEVGSAVRGLLDNM